VFVAALCAVAGAAHADKVYKWVDRNGVVHYGDRPPDGASAQPSRVEVIPVRAEPGAMARLRVEQEGAHYLAWAENALYGPIEVRLRFVRSENVAGLPALPARATVPALSKALVSRLQVMDPARGGQFELQLDGVPGDPSARPLDVEYLVPLRAPGGVRIDQGYGGRFSHTDPQNRYAIDFAAREGTQVVAARRGLVMQVESDFDKAGLNREKYGGRANFVRILHDDGTMALYAHLKLDGVMVRAGQRVRAGQLIGLSGNTGYTTGPHLHFAVQVNRGMKLESIPFRLGPLPRPATAGR
jgi:murein DD-endopeptidase MepM/ murein hydrolase activator NlpD